MTKPIPAVGKRIKYRLSGFQGYLTGTVVVSRPDCFDVKGYENKWSTVLSGDNDFELI